MKYTLILILSLGLLQCTSNKNVSSTTSQNNVELKTDSNSGDADDCYSDRKETSRIDKQTATVVYIMNTYMFFFDYTRLNPCKVPGDFSVEGIEVVISGSLREIRPNERLAGTPFVLEDIKMKN